jgi:hypothetical protein
MPRAKTSDGKRCRRKLKRDIIPRNLDTALLQDAQQFGLELERNLADLIQKYCSPIGQLKPADLLRDGAGKGASLMPKQFTFQQSGWDGRAVQSYEGTRMPRAKIMQSTGRSVPFPCRSRHR